MCKGPLGFSRLSFLRRYEGPAAITVRFEDTAVPGGSIELILVQALALDVCDRLIKDFPKLLDGPHQQDHIQVGHIPDPG